jgi:hypothetical protein
MPEERAPTSRGFDPLSFDADDPFSQDDPFAEAAPFGDVGPAPDAAGGPAPEAGDGAGDFDEPSRARAAALDAAEKAKEAAEKASRAARKEMPAWVGEAFGWLSLGIAGVVFIGGLTMAGWASHALDLDAALMPTMERGFGVRPPRSSVGLDDAVLGELEEAAKTRRAERDWGLEAVAWRRVLGHAPEKESARRRLAKLLRLLGETRPVDAVLK